MKAGAANDGEIPHWALAVLADPATNQALTEIPVIADAHGHSRVPLHSRNQPIAYLLEKSRAELAALAETYDPMTALVRRGAEVLRPSQLAFRSRLKRLASELPDGAIVADHACNDAEFAPMFAHCRYIGFDIWPRAIEYAIASGRIGFGVVADVRRPALKLESVHAIISTSTLVHLPPKEIVQAACNLLRFVAPRGVVALTIPRQFGREFIESLPAKWLVREHVGLGGPVDRTWDSRVTKPVSRIARRLSNSRVAARLAVAQNVLAQKVARMEQFGHSWGVSEPTEDWIVVARASF